ncbi:Phosphoglycerate mutase [Desulfovibrio sp. X2]|uniref:histidine phosphatase family protein n=1 Tax=Desulfovibrio sp. X2 TaxID=941449 RepID=UPI000358F318|nr:histidine phosphatase family protein [Desulfovibrio sp. X2]EPR41247.1 Phosphoglycerate mutase [Desulfovibrio sp. X2]
MRLTVHLLRHGQTEVQRPWRFLGQRDVPLTEKGLAQAAAWREPLTRVPFARVYCSDLLRCRQTAEAALDGRAVEVTYLPGLREIDLGAWDGLTADEVRERFPGEFDMRGADMATHRPEGGESFADLMERATAALSSILAELEARPGKERHALVICHAGVIRTLLCHALGMPVDNLFRLDLGYCRRCVLQWRGDGPHLLAFNQDAAAALCAAADELD